MASPVWCWLLAVVIIPAVVLANPMRGPSCGYESCPKPKPDAINIHLVPHTHDDVGWLKTVDQYYYGSLNNIQDAGVQYILDSVVQELIHDPRKRFIYVETAFFWKWWQEQTDSLRHQVKKLVNRGQLEFIGGAWSMHDEATTHYHSIIDQFTWGLRRLNDTFGECGRPRVGWQIDPFGHSRESASIMAKIGFDGLFLGRIDWQDKDTRLKQKTAEMIWLTSHNDKSNASKLFTSVMYNVYSAPKGFCFDINCHDEPIIDNKKSPIYNADKRVTEFLNIMADYAKAYRTNNVIVTMGEDFMYMDAHMYFKNMDKLIQHINSRHANEGSQFYAFYSTPSCYLKAVHDTGTPLPTKADDFMPYSSDPMAFWTGYFTSRPTIKYFERKGNNFLQVCKQLYSLSGLGPEERGDLNVMREAMGVMQHHDAITGTEKQHVARDYARILTDGFKECSVITDSALNQLMGNGSAPKTATYSCMLHNISSCSFTEENDSYIVTVYNPLSRRVDRLIKLPIESNSYTYTILDPNGKEVVNQVVALPPEVLNIPGRNSTARAELVFIAIQVPPLGFYSYYVKRNNDSFNQDYEVEFKGEPITLGFDKGSSISLDANGMLVKVGMLGREMPLEQAFYYYNSAVGNNKVFQNRSSGAYIFRPNGSEVIINDKFKVKIIDGPVLKEVRITYSDWVSQIMRISQGDSFVEFEWLVGPIPVSSIGKEVVNRFKTAAIHNNGEFWTDSNGREMLQRHLNYRPTWKVELSEKVPGNYYPVTTAISITGSNNSRLTVVTDRAQGGSSLNDGEIELMVHRRLTHDDSFGVGEALNETAFGEGLVARGSHFVTINDMTHVRLLVQQKVMDSWVFLSPTEGRSFDEWAKTYAMKFSGLTSEISDAVKILTLEPWIGSSYLIRLEHYMERDDDPNAFLPVEVDLQKLFSLWKISSIEEMMLGANQKVSESKRLIWKSEEDEVSKPERSHSNEKMSQIITFQPMQIRTFIVELKQK